MASPQFDRAAIEHLLGLLSDRLQGRGVAAEIFVLGGSAIAMAYDARRVTADIDAVFSPVQPVLDEAAAMAVELGLPQHWLSRGVADTLHGVRKDDAPAELIRRGSVVVSVASPDYVLALKAMISGREWDQDIEDAAVLCRLVGVGTEEELEAVVARYFPPTALGAQELRFERIIDRVHQMPADLALRGDAPLPQSPEASCSHWMPRARRTCRLPRHHRGQHR